MQEVNIRRRYYNLECRDLTGNWSTACANAFSVGLTETSDVFFSQTPPIAVKAIAFAGWPIPWGIVYHSLVRVKGRPLCQLPHDGHSHHDQKNECSRFHFEFLNPILLFSDLEISQN